MEARMRNEVKGPNEVKVSIEVVIPGRTLQAEVMMHDCNRCHAAYVWAQAALDAAVKRLVQDFKGKLVIHEDEDDGEAQQDSGRGVVQD
jgi:hypothetical protein